MHSPPIFLNKGGVKSQTCQIQAFLMSFGLCFYSDRRQCRDASWCLHSSCVCCSSPRRPCPATRSASSQLRAPPTSATSSSPALHGSSNARLPARLRPSHQASPPPSPRCTRRYDFLCLRCPRRLMSESSIVAPSSLPAKGIRSIALGSTRTPRPFSSL